MRSLRYFMAVFEALLAALAFSAFAAALAVVVHLSTRQPPATGPARTVVVQELGRAMVESALGGVFALWMGRCAVRNFRDAKAKAAGDASRRQECPP